MNTDSELATELEVARTELTAWRSGQPKGQKIPEAVWKTAVRAARRHGVNPVSKALGLDYSCLKKRVGERGQSRRGPMVATPAFVEMLPDVASRDLACVIEFEKGNERKIGSDLETRICRFGGSSPAGLLTFARTLRRCHAASYGRPRLRSGRERGQTESADKNRQ